MYSLSFPPARASNRDKHVHGIPALTFGEARVSNGRRILVEGRGGAVRDLPPLDLALDMESLFAAERILIPYRNEVRARAFSRVTRGTHLPRASFAARSSRRRQLLVAAGLLLALTSAAVAALEIRRWLERPFGLGLVGEDARPTSTRQSGVVTSSTEASPSPSSAKAMRAEEYRRELEILEPARRAFARGDFAAVIRAADEHRRTFPLGGLAEERDAMRARALFRQGHSADARLAAIAFRRKFPNSAVLGEIEQ
jgi:hypothetical protein